MRMRIPQGLTYDPAVVGQGSLMDFASRGDGGRISDEPDTAAVHYRYDGWLFPRAGLVFVWSLPDERDARDTPHVSGLKRRVGGTKPDD